MFSYYQNAEMGKTMLAGGMLFTKTVLSLTGGMRWSSLDGFFDKILHDVCCGIASSNTWQQHEKKAKAGSPHFCLFFLF